MSVQGRTLIAHIKRLQTDNAALLEALKRIEYLSEAFDLSTEKGRMALAQAIMEAGDKARAAIAQAKR